MCGRSQDELALEVDHIIAVAEGGTDQLDNLATLCSDCNGGKSAYRFTDYRTIHIAPPNVKDRFKFHHDPRGGDFERYHLYLYYKEGIHPGGPDGTFHHSWTISGTVFDTSSDKTALEHRPRSEEEVKFLVAVKCKLVADRKRLIENEEGLCKIDG